MISVSRMAVIANANFEYIPEEYVLIGLSINSSSSLNLIILSNSFGVGDQCFTNCPNLVVYTNSNSIRSSKDPYFWNPLNRPIYYAGQWEFDEEGNPIPYF